MSAISNKVPITLTKKMQDDVQDRMRFGRVINWITVNATQGLVTMLSHVDMITFTQLTV